MIAQLTTPIKKVAHHKVVGYLFTIQVFSMHFKYLDMKSLLLKAVIPCAIILVILFAYGDVRHHQFLNFDDNDYVTENNHVQHGLNLKEIRWAFGFTGIGYWHPLTWISHMLDCRLFGLAPGPHHMVNVALHILNALFLFLILFRMTGAPYKAAIVALLFAVHPVNIESVAWVAERKTVLSMFFLMTAIYSYVLYTEKKKVWFYLVSLFLYGIGLMCKPSILTLPFLLLVLDYWPLGRFGRGAAYPSVGTTPFRCSLTRSPAFRQSEAAFLFLEKVPFIILSLISSYLSMISLSKFHAVINHDLVPVDLRIYNLFVSIMKYLGNVAWPIELSIFYPFPKSIPSAYFLLSLLFVVIATVGTVMWRKGRPWLPAGWFWFLIALAPAGGLIQAGLWPEMANRFMYIPMIGLFLMLVWECDARIRGRYSRILKVILCCAMLAYFVSLTKVQNIYFSNSYALFTRVATVTDDNYLAYTSIGAALLSLNRVDEAMTYFGKAIAINPKYDLALNNYGVCLTKKGDFINAGLYYSRAIAINPKQYTDAYANFAWNQYQRGYPDEAKKLLAKAMELDPDKGNAHGILGIILMAEGKTDEAILHFKIMVEQKPNLAEARFNLSNAYEIAGLYDQAMAEYEALEKMTTVDKGTIYYQMAGVLAQQNRFEECKRYLELSLQYRFDVSERLKSDGRFKTFRKSPIYTPFLANQEIKRH
ncbi:tetratricopeptide repeat protein [bacterium]|nr:MAG: tetratricopeptide repeat protein [bacterium]